MSPRGVVLRDSTLREGEDVPGLRFTLEEKLRLAAALALLGVREIELGAPSRPEQSRPLHRLIKARKLPLTTSGLVFASDDPGPALRRAAFFDRVDMLVPLAFRGPATPDGKREAMLRALKAARRAGFRDAGAGFPHATSADPAFVAAMAAAAADAGAARVVLYDTNGRASPEQMARLTAAVRARVLVPIHVHCHNDLGLALANTLAAIDAGASIADCTLLGLGDRAGNCALEPLAVNLAARGYRSGLRLRRLKSVSDDAASITRLRPLNFPVTGEFAFAHSTRTHLRKPEIFEAFPPESVGARRSVLDEDGVPESPAAQAVLDALAARRSTRAFRPDPVPAAHLSRLLAAATLAPSSLGGRPWHFVVVEDRARLSALAAIKNRHLTDEKRGYRADFLRRAPCLIVVCVDRARSHGRETENAALAAANIATLAPALGLGTTFLTAWRDGDPALEREISAALGLPKRVAPRVLLPVGYPGVTAASRSAPRLAGRIHREIWGRSRAR